MEIWGKYSEKDKMRVEMDSKTKEGILSTIWVDLKNNHKSEKNLEKYPREPKNLKNSKENLVKFLVLD